MDNKNISKVKRANVDFIVDEGRLGKRHRDERHRTGFLAVRTVEQGNGASAGVELCGSISSIAMNDATLSLQTVGGMALCTTNLTVLWVEISMRCGQDELYPEGLEYELYCAAATNDLRAARLLGSLPWRRLSKEDCTTGNGQ